MSTGPSIRCEALPLHTAGLIVTSQPGIGIPLSQIASGGSDGTSPLYDAVVAAGGTVSALSEVRVVAGTGTHGTYVPNEQGGGIFTGDGSYDTVTVNYFLDGAALSSAPMNFGGGSATASPLGVSMATAVGTATATGGALASPVGLGVAMFVGTAAATGAGSGAAVAQPAGVSAAILAGAATATGGAAASATAYPVGVSAFARVGFAIASGSGAAGSIPSDYQFHAGHRVRLYTGQQGDFSPKRAAEVEIYGVDFADELAIGESISAAAWSITPVNGIDPAASSMIIGSAQLVGSVSAQRIGGGVPGIRYAPICTVQTSLGQILVLPEYGAGLLEVTL